MQKGEHTVKADTKQSRDEEGFSEHKLKQRQNNAEEKKKESLQQLLMFMIFAK